MNNEESDGATSIFYGLALAWVVGITVFMTAIIAGAAPQTFTPRGLAAAALWFPILIVLTAVANDIMERVFGVNSEDIKGSSRENRNG